jgi:nicotinamidase-related amidase
VDLAPSTTAVLTMELQRGICGDLARFAALRDAVFERGVEANTARLLAAARSAGATVVHCTFSVRDDRAGTNFDLPLLRAFRDDPDYLRHGTPAVELLPSLGPDADDLVVHRHHGVSPFGGTTLDADLRSRDIETVVVTGVSINVGVIGTVIEAVNTGYVVVVAVDCVAGLPVDYGDEVLRNSLAPIATLAPSTDVIAALAGR